MIAGSGPRPALLAKNLSKTFAGSRALSNLDLDLVAGEVHALLGQNGSGKSTFIKILSGYHTPDAGGEVWVQGESMSFGSPQASAHLGMRFVHQDLALIDSLSVADNLCLASGFATRALCTVSSRQMREDALRDLASVGLDVDPAVSVSSLVPAVKAGVAIARALKGIANIPINALVLDEPTATFTHHEVEQLLAIVRTVAARGVAVLYVSHHLSETFAIADRVTVLRDGRNAGTWGASELNRDSLVSALVGNLADIDADRRAAAAPASSGRPRPLLEVDGLHSGIINGVDLSVRAGEIVGIAGLVGSGREELLPAIFGANIRQGGVVRIDGQEVARSRPDASVAAGLAYVPADRKRNALFANLTVRENLTISDLAKFWRFPRLRRRLESAEVRSWVELLDIKPKDGQELLACLLSGGNQQKVVLARWLRHGSKVLLLAEPTEGVDVGAQVEIHRQILASAARGGAVMISSADSEELCRLCDRVLVMQRGRVIATLADDTLTESSIVSVSSHDLPAGAR
jgi:ribose transport system ATP-binding protein